jgi:Glycosyltransferases involved in cell wall biogenesis
MILCDNLPVKISATIITLDEEANIGRALSSLDWADEIVVVDSGSTDQTCQIAESFGAKVVAREWIGFSDQKQFAAESAANDWIFSLDADEEVSPDLRDEIEKLRASDLHSDAYKIPRLAFYMGRPIRHSGWYPDKQLRLYNKTRGRWKNVPVHESVEMDADSKTTDLRYDILHYSVEDASHHHRMIGERYAPLAARAMFDSGRRTSAAAILLAGPSAFVRSYLIKAGFLDGLPGIAIANFAAHHAFLKHLMLRELQDQAQAPITTINRR